MRVVNLRAVVLFLFGMFAMAMCPGQAWFGVHSTANAQDNPFGASTEMVAQDDPFGADAPFSSSRPARGTVTRRAPAVSQNDLRSAGETSDKSASAKSNSPSIATAANDRVRRQLEHPCDFAFDETSYSEVARQIENTFDINIVLTESARDDALTEDETFTSGLSSISHASALRIILAEKNATYVIQDGIIKIISLDEANDEKWCVRRMIDVNETLGLIRVAERDRIGKPMPDQIIAPVALPSGGGGGVFAIQFGGGGTSTKKAAVEGKEIKQLADAIVQAVKDSQPKVQRTVKLVTAESILIDAIDPNEEIRMNGPSITCVGGVLIVNAPEAVNDRVESFVEDLTFVMKAAAEKKR